MSIKRVKAGSGERCAPKEGEIICVEARRLDRSQAHRHFGPNEMTKAKLFEKQERVAEHPPDKPPPPSTDTFEAFAEVWRAAQSPADPTAVHTPLKRAYAEIGEMRLVDLSKLRLQALQKTLLTRYARNTVKLTMHYTKAVMRQAFDDGLIPSDPTIRLQMPRRDTRDSAGIVTADDVPTHAEALAILAAAAASFRIAVALGIGCGLRIGEILGVTPAQVDLEAGTLTIDAQQARRGRVGPKTWRGKRTIDLPDVVLFYLRRIMGEDPTSQVPFLVVSRADFYKEWQAALKAAGLDPMRFKFHAARHYCVSAMLARGVPLAEVAAYVGDAVETIASTYAHWLRDSDPMAKTALNAALGPVPEPEAEDGEATGEGGTQA